MATTELSINRDVAIRDAAAADFPRICELNLAEVEYTSEMGLVRLGTLARLACYLKVACIDGRVLAFLLAMRTDAPYDNDNFRWFSSRYADFIYVDRIVVSAEARGLRVGTRLYEDLFQYARAHAIPFVTCEYNIFPPNEPSRVFHDRFGFKEQGTQWVAGHTKRVSLQAAAT
jgi:predicted GNAT superfamily acetyltransferase